MNRKTIAGLVLGAAVVSSAGLSPSVARAHWGQPMMTDEQREQMMEDHGGDYGMRPGPMGYGMMGPGMMGPGTMGYGMMGPGMVGPGMMGPGMMGYGMMGPGMMGPGMMGPGPMGMDLSRTLNLTAEQRTRIHGIQDEQQQENWNTMGKIMEQRRALRDLYDADQWDPKAIGAVYGKIFELKRQMIEASITAHNRLEAVLTKEQREQLSQWSWGAAMHGRAQGEHHDRMHGGMMSQ